MIRSVRACVLVITVSAFGLSGCGSDDEETGGGSGLGVPAPGEVLTVEPGGDTICSRGTPFRFFVAGGDSKKIVIDFRGGGACWNAITCSIKDAIFSAEAPTEEQTKADLAGGAGGIYRLGDARNPLTGWTLVHIPYCTGDIHWGDATVDYSPSLTIHHKGFVNASAVLAWVYEHYQPEEILVTGCSAGAYGAIGHAPFVADHYPNAKISVVADSGCGVVTDTFFKDSFPNWNAQLPTQVEGLKGKDITTLTIDDLYTAVGQAYPNMRIAEQTAAFDDDQTFYYGAMGGNEADWSSKMQQSLANISAGTPNFRYYLSPGPLHCLHPYDSMFERTSEGTKYTDWLTQFLTAPNAPASVGCTSASCTQDPVCDACKSGASTGPECGWCKDWTSQ